MTQYKLDEGKEIKRERKDKTDGLGALVCVCVCLCVCLGVCVGVSVLLLFVVLLLDLLLERKA